MRDFDSSQGYNVKQDKDDSGSGERRARESSLAYSNADEPKRVDGGDEEREAVDPCDGSEAGEDGTVDLGDTEEIPGQAGDPGACQLYRNPGEGYKEQGCLSSETNPKYGQ